MSFETFNQIFFWVFTATSIVFCLLFFWKAFAGYRAAESKMAAVIKAIVCFAIWIAATLAVVVAGAGYFAGHSPISDDRRMIELESATVYLISFIIGWVLVGAAIVYFISRPQHKNYGSN